MKCYVTLPEARNSLPQVERQLKKAIKIKRAIDLLDEVEIVHEDEFSTIQQQVELNKQFHHLSYKLYRELQNMSKKGAIVKDIDKGLVDFFSLHEGREIFLCWKLGEKTIRHWHEIEDGFEERKPASLLLRTSPKYPPDLR